MYDNLNRNTDTGKYEIVRPGMVSPERYVPEHIEKPDYFYVNDIPDMYKSFKAEIKHAKAVQSMRESCRLAANILDSCSKILKVKLHLKNSMTLFLMCFCICSQD